MHVYKLHTITVYNVLLFQDIEAKQKAVSDMQRVIDEPAMGQSDLDQLNHQVGFSFHKILHQYIVAHNPSTNPRTCHITVP